MAIKIIILIIKWHMLVTIRDCLKAKPTIGASWHLSLLAEGLQIIISYLLMFRRFFRKSGGGSLGWVDGVVWVVDGCGLTLKIEMLTLHWFCLRCEKAARDVCVVVCEGRTLASQASNIANKRFSVLLLLINCKVLEEWRVDVVSSLLKPTPHRKIDTFPIQFIYKWFQIHFTLLA